MSLAYATLPSTSYKPSFRVIDELDAYPIGSALKGETLLYQASLDFAYSKGGPITREFIDACPLHEDNVIVDVRVHHLTAGMYPAIPGYHLDWIPRTKGGEEPDMSVIPDYRHVVMILGQTSLTEFVAEPISIPNLPERGKFEYCNDYIKDQGFKTWNVNSGQLVEFTSHDWHRPVPAEGREWRMLIRASRVDHVKAKNEIRTQSQVYIPVKEANWK